MIPHNGGPMPVADSVMVRVKFKDEMVDEDTAGTWLNCFGTDMWYWDREDRDSDDERYHIVEYKILDEE